MTADSTIGDRLEAGIAELRRRRGLAASHGDPDRVARHRLRGFLTARERVELLLDPGTMLPFGPFVNSGVPGEEDRTISDGMLLGFGTIHGRTVAYHADDPTVKGSSSAIAALRPKAFERIVESAAIPLFELAHHGGGRITDIMTSRMSGAGGGSSNKRSAFSPGPRQRYFVAALGNFFGPWRAPDADFRVMTKSSVYCITSPPIVEEATGNKISADELGGWEVQAKITGQMDLVANTDADAILTLKNVFSYTPSTIWDTAPVVDTGDSPLRRDEALRTLVPDKPGRAYDVKALIESIVDRGSFLEILPDFARNLVVGLARLDGHPVVITANQPMHRAGVIDVGATIKASRAFQYCERFQLPHVSLLDTGGALPSKDQEYARLITHIVDLQIQRLRSAVPKITVVLRKAYGYGIWPITAFDKEWYSYAWPTAQIAFMGPEAMVRVAFRRDWESAPDPSAFLQRWSEELAREAEPWEGAELGYIDDVIDPADTRSILIRTLRVSRNRMGESCGHCAGSVER